MYVVASISKVKMYYRSAITGMDFSRPTEYSVSTFDEYRP